VNSAAFFTPNCTPKDISGAPSRTGGAAATTTTASTGTLAAPNYGACSFTGTPADDAQTTALTSSGQTITVVTDQNGQFTVTVAEARDAAFDDDGLVDVNVTATPAGGTALGTRQVGSTNASNGANCNTLSNGTFTPGAGGPFAAQGGCATLPVEFSTRIKALNGSAISVDPISGPAYGANNPTPDNPGTQAAIFVVHLKDQYGNLTLSSQTGAAGNDYATLTKTGQGVLISCGPGPYASNAPCPNNGPAGTVTTENNGTTKQVAQVRGSFTNNNWQERFSARPDTDINGDPVDGTMTLTAKWVAPITEYKVGTTNDAATGTKISGFDQTEVDNIFTQVITFEFYKQEAKSITFKTTPGSTVPVGTVVTVQAIVKDQFDRPLQGYPVQFFRGGSSNNCTQTANNGTGGGGALFTDNAGTASYSFSCAEASTQNITAVVYDTTTGGGQGGELGRATQSVIFTGATVQPTSTATPTATATPTSSPSVCPGNGGNLAFTIGAPIGKVGKAGTGPVVNATALVTVTVTGAPAGSQVALEAYQQNHYGTATFANAGNTRTATADANGAATFQVRFSSNARIRARLANCAFTSNAGFDKGVNANGNVLYVRTVLTFTVTRTGVKTYSISGDSLPARPGGLVVNVNCTDQRCKTAFQGRPNPNGIVLQLRANQATGEFGPGDLHFGSNWKVGERATLYAVTGDPATGAGDAQNVAGRSNNRSLLLS
jgi:hypothetical protein